MVVCTCVMFGSLVRRSRSSDDDDHISSYREYNDVMSKEGLVQVLVRNAQNLQNVERFGYSDPHVVLELEGEIYQWGSRDECTCSAVPITLLVCATWGGTNFF